MFEGEEPGDKFIGTCVELRSHDLNSYDDTSRPIMSDTFKKYVGADVVRGINKATTVKISEDWAVSFSSGIWRGEPAVCMMHSSIHHLWYK